MRIGFPMVIKPLKGKKGGAVTAGTAGVLAMVLWDDITDEGPQTLMAGACGTSGYDVSRGFPPAQPVRSSPRNGPLRPPDRVPAPGR